MLKQLENKNRQLRILDVIQVLMAQSTKLIEIVNANQKEVNRLKTEVEKLDEYSMDTIQLKRIADAIEEILRLVKKDMEPRTKEKN